MPKIESGGGLGSRSCPACGRGLGAHTEGHTRLSQIEKQLGAQIEAASAGGVAEKLRSLSAEQFAEFLKKIAANPGALKDIT